jgi:2-phosphoglycerate kinase
VLIRHIDVMAVEGMGPNTSLGSGSHRPRLLLIAGATGTGKSTASIKIAQREGFQRIVSTDNIREVLRSVDADESNRALHRSSYSLGETKEPVQDWLDTCQVLEDAILATIAKSRREGFDLVIEGVHIVPSERILRSWTESGGFAMGVVLVVHDENLHQGMFVEREMNTYRKAERYIANLGRIRAIQDGLIERAKIANWPIVDPHRVDDDVERIITLFRRKQAEEESAS